MDRESVISWIIFILVVALGITFAVVVCKSDLPIWMKLLLLK